MADKMSIEGPVKVQPMDASPARVAFELMKYLNTVGSTEEERSKREYWLTLYCQCHKAASGYSLKTILKAG